MKSISLLTSLAAVSALCVSFACSSKSDDNGTATAGTSAGDAGDAGDAASDAGGAARAGSTARGGAPTTGDAGAGDVPSSAGDSSTAGDPGTIGGDGATSCSTGALFAGNPVYDEDFDYANLEPAGQPLLADVPLRYRDMAFIGDRLFVQTQLEVWSADLSKNPVVISRLAGNEPVTDTTNARIEAGVACKDTQFMIIEGIAATPSGTLIVADGRGGALVELTDPGLATCQSHYVAGTHAKFLDSDVGTENAANPGDVDGKGVDAKFLGVSKPIVAPNGNIFVYDEGNDKLKKVATDADRTVSTIATFDDNIFALAYLNGKVYASGSDGANDVLLEIDPSKTANNVKEVYRDNAHFSELDHALAVITALVPDGDALIGGGKGYIWRIGTDGTVIATLAGTGAAIDWPLDFDPTKPHAAKDWVLENTGAGQQWMTLDRGKLYWAGGVGIARYVLQLSCP
ncbi:MAG: hypothetical protein ABUL62_17900 [Myxococcales bacterium]